MTADSEMEVEVGMVPDMMGCCCSVVFWCWVVRWLKGDLGPACPLEHDVEARFVERVAPPLPVLGNPYQPLTLPHNACKD